jgi:lysozyme
MKVMNGIDVSSNNLGLDIRKLKGVDFVIVKATEGTQYVNPDMAAQIRGTLDSGRQLGLYHYAKSGSPVAEADFFLKTVGAHLGKAPLFLDWEDRGALAKGPTAALLFLERIFLRTGVRPLLYTSLDIENNYDWGRVVEANYGLWVAQYNNYNTVNGFEMRDLYGRLVHWPNCAMHQYSSCGRLSGYNGNLDFNVFFGDPAAWQKYAQVDKRVTQSVVAEMTPHKLRIDGFWGHDTTIALQEHEGTTVDGIISRPSQVIRVVQRHLHVGVDGFCGQATTRAMQEALGTPMDGVISQPSAMVREMQRRLNGSSLPF